MPAREILTYPNAKLTELSSEAIESAPDFRALLADLLDTLNAFPGCVGVAAPQIGELKRVVVVDASRNRKPVPNQGLLILVNPVIQSCEGEEIMREGCLSIPDFTANVKRAKRISLVATLYSNADSAGVATKIEADNFEARVIQHELDHLEGKLFLDRVSSLKTDVFRRKRYAVPEST